MIDAALQLSQEALDLSNQAAVLQKGGKIKHWSLRILLLAAAAFAVLGPIAFHIIRTGDVASKNGTGPELRQGVLFLNYGEDSSGVEMCDTPTRLFMALESHADDYAARMAARSTWLRWAAHGAAGERAEYVFFSTDTVDTRAEALIHGDLVLLTDSGMSREKTASVQRNPQTADTGSTSGLNRHGARSVPLSSNGDRADPAKRARNRTIIAKGVAPAAAEGAHPKEGDEVKRHPKLCRDDQARLCSGLEAGGGRIDNCMFAFRKELNSACRADLAAFETANLGSKARDWYGKSNSNPGRQLLGLLSKMGLYGQQESTNHDGSEAGSSSSKEKQAGHAKGQFDGSSGSAERHPDVASRSSGAPASSTEHPPKPQGQQGLPWCGEAGHHPTSSSSSSTASSSSSSSSSSWFSTSSSSSSTPGSGGSGSRLGGCLARPISSLGGQTFRAPKPFVHHSNVRSEQPFSGGAGSGLGSVHSPSSPSTNAPHLVSRFRFAALEWAVKHAPPHAFFLWLDLTPRAPYAPLTPQSGPSSFQSARQDTDHDASSSSGSGGYLSGLGSLFNSRSSRGATTSGADSEPAATPPPLQGKYSFLCLPSLLAELETRPHERFLWRRLPCGSTTTATSGSANDPPTGAEVAAALQDDSFLLMSRDVAELLRGVARKPLPKSGHLLLLDRLLKRLPLTLLHDPRRLVRSSEVNWSDYEMLPVRGSEKPHPCDCLVWIHGASSHPMLPQPDPSSTSSNPSDSAGTSSGGSQGWTSILSGSFRRNLLVPPRHKLPSAQQATAASSSSWWSESSAAKAAAAAVAASAAGLGDDDGAAVEAAGGTLQALAASYWSGGKKGDARAAKLEHLTSKNATVQRLFRAHAHLRFGLEPGDGKSKWNEWRKGADESRGGGYPLVGHTSAEQARECRLADEPWSSLHVEMPGGVRSGATKSDRELVTAVRLGLSMPRAEAFLAQLRVLAATTATSSSSSLSGTGGASSVGNNPVRAEPKNYESNPTGGGKRGGKSAAHEEMRAAAAAAVAFDADAGEEAPLSKGNSVRNRQEPEEESDGKGEERRKLGGSKIKDGASSHKQQRRQERAQATSLAVDSNENSNANSLEARANEARGGWRDSDKGQDPSSAGRSGRFTGPDRTYGPDNMNSATGARRRSSASSGNKWKRGAGQLPRVGVGEEAATGSSGSRRTHLSVQQKTEDEQELDEGAAANLEDFDGEDVDKPSTRRSLLKEWQSLRKNARRAADQASTMSTTATASSSATSTGSSGDRGSAGKKKRAVPSLGAQVSSKNEPRSSSLHSSKKGASSASKARSLLPEVTSLGVRPRLHAWSEQVEDAQPVVDACSFDLECAWERVASEELRDLWQEADVARASCCCAARVSQAPPTCAAYKTRTFLLEDTEDDEGGEEEDGNESTGGTGRESQDNNLKKPPSEAAAFAKKEGGDELPSNWTYAQEVEWLNSYARRQRRQRKLQGRDSESSSGIGDRMLQENQRTTQRRRGVAMLSSFPGSGNTWVRLLVEYASGVFTGSIYHDTALSPLLPAEGDMSSRVALVKAHTTPEHFLAKIQKAHSITTRMREQEKGRSTAVVASVESNNEQTETNEKGREVAMVHPLANTGVQRVVLLVRHPLDAIWSEYQRRQTGGNSHTEQVSQVSARDFEGFATCMACKWQQHLLKHVHLASNPWALFPTTAMKQRSSRKNNKRGAIRVHLLQYERLRGGKSFTDELAKLLAFLDLPLPSPQRLACAPLLARHGAVHRPKPPNFKVSDVYHAIPGLSCRLWRVLTAPSASKLMLRLLGYTMPITSATNRSDTSEETCPVDDNNALPLGVCGDVMVNPDLPLQGCAGKSLAKFYPKYKSYSKTSLRGSGTAIDAGAAKAQEELVIGSNADNDDQVVHAMNGPVNSNSATLEHGKDDEEEEEKKQQEAAIEAAWQLALQPLAQTREGAWASGATGTEVGEGDDRKDALSSGREVKKAAVVASVASSLTTAVDHNNDNNGNAISEERKSEIATENDKESFSEPQIIAATPISSESSPATPPAHTATAAKATIQSAILAKRTTSGGEHLECGSSSSSSSTSSRPVKQPLVAILVSTTSRGVVKKGKTKALSAPELEKRMAWVEDTTKTLDFSELVLFTTMLPSLAASLECGYRYKAVIGFDTGDLLYDTVKTQTAVADWLQKHWVAVAKARGIEAAYQLLPVRNTLKKPGPVFNALAAAVSGNGGNGGGAIAGSRATTAAAEVADVADYIYRVNDDTEFKRDSWTSKFVKALQKLRSSDESPLLGVVGPSCPQGNRAILTHDFTHKTHLAVFGTYYPPELVDWWMDDWISRVYGSKRTLLLPNVEVVHHSKTYGRRYDVDGSNRHKVDNLVDKGKGLVVDYMIKHGATAREVQAYKSDSFNHRQSQKEVDQSTLVRKSAAVRPPGS